jgi:hypothetical protein
MLLLGATCEAELTCSSHATCTSKLRGKHHALACQAAYAMLCYARWPRYHHSS